MWCLEKTLLIFMKFFFKLFFFIFFCSAPLSSADLYAEYQIKTKGIMIGSLNWKLEITENYYNTFIKLNNKGFFSRFYKFKGRYTSLGKIKNSTFIPMRYNQSWITKNKERDVKIIFKDQKISELLIIPTEKELPRIKYKSLRNYSDPLTSFINILINGLPSYTIDGRRAYLLFPEKNNNFDKILIKEYTNIWADHKRNDLEFLEIYHDKKTILPKKINIKFKGSVFSLNKI